MRDKPEKRYYFDCLIEGSVAVYVMAPNKREAIEKFKEGIWDDRMDVSIGPIKGSGIVGDLVS